LAEMSFSALETSSNRPAQIIAEVTHLTGIS
jgi:hypothetical protein